MRRRTLPEKRASAPPLLARTARTALTAGLAALLTGAGPAACASDHHVSPWGTQPGPSLEAYAPRADLEARLAAVDAETAALGLSRGAEIRIDLPKRAGAAVIRGYDGHDAAGRAVHAVRVATPLGVVMAVGPLDIAEVDRQAATELVPALLGGGPRGDAPGAYRSGTDLNGDGLVDVVLRNEAGVIAIWHVDALGSGAYPIAMETPPTRALDIDDDGRIDLLGELPLAPGDTVSPRFRDVATFDAGRYSDTSEAARAWHARAMLGAIAAASAPDAVRLRATLEHAWHEVLAGLRPAGTVADELRRASVPAALRPSFERHVRVIASLPPRR